mgnify:CR=1 FL=1
MDDPVVLWKACAEVLRDQVSEAVWLTTFHAIEPVALEGNRLVLAVPNQLVKDRVENRYLTLVKSALGDVDALAVAMGKMLDNPTPAETLKSRAADFEVGRIGDLYEGLLEA